MRTQRYSLKGYKIDYSGNVIYMNYKFAKKAQDYGSPEYRLLQNLKADFPMMSTVVRAGRKIDTTNIKKRFTYENMSEHIKAYSNADELLERFELAKSLSKPLASPYKYVCDWFTSQFPDYRDVNRSVNDAFTDIDLIDLPDINNYDKKDNYIA